MGNQRNQRQVLHSKTHHERQKDHNVMLFTNQGPAIQIDVPKGKSVNAKFYKATGLRGVRLVHGNASSHKAAIVREYLKQGKVV
jgi:hypothetical protein